MVALALPRGRRCLVAPGIATRSRALPWPGATLLTAGLAIVVASSAGSSPRPARAHARREPRRRRALPLPRGRAPVLGAMVFAAGDDTVLGVPHDRWLLIHLDVGALGWLTLLILAVGRTLGPMLALAPAAPADAPRSTSSR